MAKLSRLSPSFQTVLHGRDLSKTFQTCSQPADTQGEACTTRELASIKIMKLESVVVLSSDAPLRNGTIAGMIVR